MLSEEHQKLKCFGPNLQGALEADDVVLEKLWIFFFLARKKAGSSLVPQKSTLFQTVGFQSICCEVTSHI